VKNVAFSRNGFGLRELAMLLRILWADFLNTLLLLLQLLQLLL